MAKASVKKAQDTPAEAVKPKVRTELDESGMIDVPFLVLTLLLVAVGLIMLFSASYARAYQVEGNSAYYFVRQAGFAAAGILIMLFVSRLNYFIWYRLSMLILGAAVLLLLLVPIAGTAENGAKRWIRIGVSFQPSEIAKLAVILSFAAMMSVFRDKMNTFQYGVLPYVAVLGVISGLLLLEPHLSATLIICILGAVMMFLGGTQKRWFLIGFLIIAAAVGLFLLTKGDYAVKRITAWLHPEQDPSDSGYQIIQSRYAIGSGGLTGLGFGKSRQKYLYLPEEHNDYIFAIVCEELGFVGALVIMALFALLIVRGYWISMHARDRFSALTAAGITTLLAIQVLLNIGVVTNVLPSTGISLPFFSYGGTALLLQLFEMGIVLGISRWGNNKLVIGKHEQ